MTYDEQIAALDRRVSALEPGNRKQVNHRSHPIIQAVCEHFEISEKTLTAKGRKWRYVWPRFIACKLLYDDGCKLAHIGLLVNRHFVCVRNGIEKFKIEIQNPKQAATVQAIRDRIERLK